MNRIYLEHHKPKYKIVFCGVKDLDHIDRTELCIIQQKKKIIKNIKRKMFLISIYVSILASKCSSLGYLMKPYIACLYM